METKMTHRLVNPALDRNAKILGHPNPISSTAFGRAPTRRGEVRTGSDTIQIPEC